MQKVILAVAPVAGDDHEIDPQSLIDDIAACAEAGASFLHLHPLRPDGSFDPDAVMFDEIVRGVHARTDIIIEGSTGSPEVPIGERFRVMEHPGVEAYTYTPGCTIVPDKGEITTTEEEMRIQRDLGNRLGLRADFQLFTHEHLENVKKLEAEAPFLKNPVYNLVYTCEAEHPVPMRRVIEDVALLPENALFGIIDCRAENMNLIMAAVLMGARFIRVGFEDCRSLGEGRTAANNAELVKLAAFLVRQAGAGIATTAEAREMLGLPG